MCECGGHSKPIPTCQTLDELDFERGLWFAAQYGDLDRALHLLKKGTYVDQRDSSGYTPLHYAARNGHLDLCRLLVEKGACVNAITNQGQATALHRAATAGENMLKINCNIVNISYYTIIDKYVLLYCVYLQVNQILSNSY